MVGLALLVPLVALALDARVAEQAERWRHPWLDALVGVLNPIGSGVTLLVACALLGVLCRWLGRSRLHDAAWLGAAAFVVAGALGFSLKHLIGRVRPDAALTAFSINGPTLAPDVDSFPSGHATSVFTLASVLASYYPRLGGPLYALAGAVAAGRVYLERHFVSDALAGAIIGVGVATWLLRYRGALPRWMQSTPAGAQPS